MEQTQRENYHLRRLRLQDDGVSIYHLAARLYDWGRLIAWPELGTCRVGIESIVSNAITPKSAFYASAHDWIRNQVDNPLVLAVCLYEATRSATTKDLIVNEVLTKYFRAKLDGVSELWQQISFLERVDWQEITVATGAVNWKAFPEDGSIYIDACRRIREKLPPDATMSLWRDSLEDLYLAAMPKLQRRLIWQAVRYGTEAELATLITRSSIMTETIATLLTKESDGSLTFVAKDIPRLFALSSALASQWHSLSDSAQKTVASIVLAQPTEFTAMLFEVMSVQTSESGLLASYLDCCLWSFVDGVSQWKWDHDQDSSERTRAETIKTGLQPLAKRFRATLDALPFELKTELLKGWMTEYDSAGLSKRPDGLDEAAIISSWLTEMDFRSTLFPLIEKGEAKWSFVALYLNAYGQSGHKLPELEGFCRNAPLINSHNDQLVAFCLVNEQVIPHQFWVGRLVTIDSVLTDSLFQLGYELKLTDLAGSSQALRLIPTDKRYEAKLVKAPFWERASWRQVILAHDEIRLVAFASIFTTAFGQPHSVNWLDTHLLPELTLQPGLWTVVIELIEARSQILVRLPDFEPCRYQVDSQVWELAESYLMTNADRLSADQKEKVKTIIETRMAISISAPSLTAFVGTFLTATEQRQILYSRADKNNYFTLPQPGSWMPFFTDAGNKTELKNWLISHYARFLSDSFLQWVRVFDFHFQPDFRVLIEKSLDESSENEVSLALELLRELDA